MKTHVKTILLFLLSCFISCKDKSLEKQNVQENVLNKTELKYASGFSIEKYKDYSLVHLKSPWPEANKEFVYALVEKGKTLPKHIKYDAKVEVPIEKIVVTSTTHIPLLEALEEEETLVGFPNTKYISSPVTRELIKEQKIAELGENESINTELLLDLEPDAVIGFAVNGNNKTFRTIENAGIPVLYNAAWIEKNILGRAEWIKFFGCLFKKEELANKIFNKIETEYNLAKNIATSIENKPTVLAGSMFKDIWHVPYGNSWAAQFITDAGGDYLWANSKGSGSISLNIESVLDKAQQAEYWITLGTETTKQQLQDRNSHYKEFEAFQNGNTFIANATGETGGLLFYELGPNRPDLILKDLIAIFHPQLVPNHQLTFYNQLK
ncbi:MAG: ABC transporter substrate-binding protein [Flavobacteriaceae bacterium]